MYCVTIIRRFAAAHQVSEAGGGCEQLHGHTWKVQFSLAGRRLDQAGMLVDFRVAKRLVDRWVERLDHTNLNQTLEGLNPTAEHIARYLFRRVAKDVSSGQYRLVGVTVWKSEDSAVWYGEKESRCDR
jgi:6-pyruvoyltetrahydropterin/6-carboxytetrahydropterin synthase